jgi:hypothetical protein
MSKPTVQEIIDYLLTKEYEQKHAEFFADQFWNFYESKGWVVGRSPMKSWKAAIRTWELKNKQNANAQAKPGTSAARLEAARKW